MALRKGLGKIVASRFNLIIKKFELALLPVGEAGRSIAAKHGGIAVLVEVNDEAGFIAHDITSKTVTEVRRHASAWCDPETGRVIAELVGDQEANQL